MISSTMPSAKYSCSGSPLMFWNGKTAIDGLSGSGKAAGSGIGFSSASTRKTWIGWAMFLRVCSPMSSNAKSSLSPIWSRTVPDTQMPPGSAMPSSRAAMLTPSPWMSSSSMITSPRLTPMRHSMRTSVASSALRSAIPRCHSVAQRIASTTLANSTSRPSPVVLTMPPVMLGDRRVDQFGAQRLQPRQRAFFVRAHQPRIARDIGGEDRGETAGRAHSVSPIARRRPDRKQLAVLGVAEAILAAFGITTDVMARSRATIARASSSRPIWA